jgi:hypothetical protein
VKRGCISGAVLTLITLLLLFSGTAAPAVGASFKERLEGYTLDPHEGWTPGGGEGVVLGRLHTLPLFGGEQGPQP